MRYIHQYETPIGRISIIADELHITELLLPIDTRNASGTTHDPDKSGLSVTETPLIKRAADQLWVYFAAKRGDSCGFAGFDLPLEPKGTSFMRGVWDVLLGIPYGSTISYKDVATRIGNPKASRAVGGAIHRNPIPIIIPCHRVIGSDGSLTGFAGGLDMKRRLLDLEKESFQSISIL